MSAGVRLEVRGPSVPFPLSCTRGGGPGCRRRIAHAAALLLFVAHAAVALEVNEATRAQLEQLNGVGVAMAERILVERDKRPFADWDDLARRVNGMRGARIERLQAQGVTVNGRGAARAVKDERKR